MTTLVRVIDTPQGPQWLEVRPLGDTRPRARCGERSMILNSNYTWWCVSVRAATPTEAELPRPRVYERTRTLQCVGIALVHGPRPISLTDYWCSGPATHIIGYRYHGTLYTHYHVTVSIISKRDAHMERDDGYKTLLPVGRYWWMVQIVTTEQTADMPVTIAHPNMSHIPDIVRIYIAGRCH